ncbi:GIY-YIG nuclease family protein [Nodosilinea sp. LEGE 07298]|uniref:GIY-YIG nuclease family protein n=1 Tax=Nodosilinea sp. LEGE 07298 TaxID=2777970 RepID=UPI001882F2B7|nr:GIY-YIG nuclease family protein [Nodosilinea sp. LEGE 07298]MBE9108913.1 GIY-YIG nuclease family protein [Nodosilinea sp. LEGE 07298]
MTSENPNAIEHQNVPVEHRSLHDFLYSAADEHAADTTAAPAVDSTSDTPIPIADWCEQTQDVKVTGVYAVLDCNRQTQFIGISRNVSLSLRSHLDQKGDATCAFVTVQPFQFPSREAMAALRDDWIAALPSPPPGNVDGTWAGTIREAATQTMSAAEREAYEAKKLKLRRAMADGALSKEQDLAQKAQAGDAQADLAAAMTDDNWSALVRDQTQETQA